jgi:hypothetical protein
VGFVVDKVALGQVFSEYFDFLCQSSFHRLLHNHHHLSSGAGKIGQQWPTYQVDSVSSHPEKLKKKTTHGVVLLHDNARPHTAAKTQDLIKTFGWEQIDHPSYSPDLAPSDFHVFLHLKKFLGGRRLLEDGDVKEAVNTWFSSQAASFYDAGIQKLVPRYDKCLNNGGNYVEK